MSYRYLDDLSDAAYQNSKNHGFWDGKDVNDIDFQLSRMALVVSEAGEAIEAIRKGDRANLEEELADILIRVFDFSGALKFSLHQAVIDKMIINVMRPYKHGKLA